MTMSMEPIIYEQPINEHVRVCLRLEHLFNQILHHLHGQDLWSSREALASIIDTLNVLDRPDLKTKFVKELGRYSTIMSRFANTPHIDHNKLSAIQNELDQTIHHLHNMQGRVGQGLRDNDFLASMRQYLQNPGGGCGFEIPALHYWLHQPAAERIAQLTQWFSAFKLTRVAVDLTLRLIRQSSAPELRVAHEGFYQASMDPQNPCQLVRVLLPYGASVYPEVSVGRHGLSIRFYNPTLDERASQTKDEVKFYLTCCVF